MGSTALVWFRLDLRLADNPVLAAAAGRCDHLVPVFIWAPEEEGDWPPGAASRWWTDLGTPGPAFGRNTIDLFVTGH